MNISMKRVSQDQQGMVSILVTMIIMIVISLIVIGFAQITRREQRQALDRQLSTQAFYAAETGINAAVKAIYQEGYTSEKTTCGPESSGALSHNIIDATTGVEYTCLLIDPTPNTLEYSSVETSDSTMIPLMAASGSLEKISLSWQDKTGGTTYSGCTTPSGGQYTFPAVSDWPAACNAGVLRIDLVPRETNLSRSGLSSHTLSAFLYPQNGAASGTNYTYTVSSPDQGAIIPVNCNGSATPRACNLHLQLAGTTGVGGYFLRVRSIYKSSALTVTGFIAGGQQIDLINAQAIIDSTGKANDVLRRIAVRVPLSNIGAAVPNFAVQTSDSLCKRFNIAPNYSPLADSSDSACGIN